MLDLVEELATLTRALDDAGLEYAVCGGLALAIYGIPRATIDIDLLVEPDAIEPLKQLAHGLGYRFEAAPMSFKGGAVQMRRVTKIDPQSADVLSLDLLVVTPEIREVWNGRVRVPWLDGTVSVVSRRGLVELKMLRGSGQDQDDIRKLEELGDEG